MCVIISDMETTTNTWKNYRETVYGKVDEDWVRKNIIRPAVEYDNTVAPWDNWRIVERNGGLQAQIQRVG